MDKRFDTMRGKICMITGANSGIGKVTALELTRYGFPSVWHGPGECGSKCGHGWECTLSSPCSSLPTVPLWRAPLSSPICLTAASRTVSWLPFGAVVPPSGAGVPPSGAGVPPSGEVVPPCANASSQPPMAGVSRVLRLAVCSSHRLPTSRSPRPTPLPSRNWSQI